MKVAIVCGAPSSEFMAPYGDLTTEIWVLGNRVDRHLDKRVSRIFEIHDDLSEHADPAAYAAYLTKLATTLRVIVGKNPLLQPKAGRKLVPYPYEAVIELYGHLYLTSSPAYMVAYAILEGATEIGLYGVDLSVSDHEYFWQRPCMEAWVGFAKGRGINVFIPEVSHVGKSNYCEGRDWNNSSENKSGAFSQDNFLAMAAEHRALQENLLHQRRELAIQAAAHDGGAQVYENLAKIARAIDANIDVHTIKEATRLRGEQ